MQCKTSWSKFKGTLKCGMKRSAVTPKRDFTFLCIMQAVYITTFFQENTIWGRFSLFENHCYRKLAVFHKSTPYLAHFISSILLLFAPFFFESQLLNGLSLEFPYMVILFNITSCFSLLNWRYSFKIVYVLKILWWSKLFMRIYLTLEFTVELSLKMEICWKRTQVDNGHLCAIETSA